MKNTSSISKSLLKHVDLTSYDSEGFVDYQKLRKNLHMKVSTLAHAVGKTSRAIEKNPHSESTQKGLRKIIYITSLLKEMLESDAEIHVWLKAPNPEFSNLSPAEVIAKGDMDAIIDYLTDLKKGALS